MPGLKEDPETGARSFRYVKTGTNHYSLAFTYDCIARTRTPWVDWSIYGWIDDEDYYDPVWHAQF